MKKLATVVLAFLGCNQMTRSIDYALINGERITDCGGKSQINEFAMTWNDRSVTFRVVSLRDIPKQDAALQRVLAMMQHTQAEEMYERSPASWPLGSTVIGVTRGTDIASFDHGQFLLKTPKVALEIEMFSGDQDSISDEELDVFFDQIRVTDEVFTVPADAGSGRRNEFELR